MLKERLIKRKIMGGLSEEEAVNFYQKSDSLNVRRVVNNSLEADLNLELLCNGKFKYR